ncbi:excinuclease ABC subunit UvrA [Candidatus Uhrbacteria bacterium]|nr:excinuclease ABC subunit UvrA [Candidatus Uhrbacteria bacterium]MBD3284587.1 excinuclease ABC subunit UvrA [Candidatus Uhrbacteria bacterium]
MTISNSIQIRGARVHNLKNVSVNLPKNKLIVITGLSGSGKSSLAFDTIHAEGQRRYMESLSSYARQFLELQDKPDVDEITGLSPTVAIDQKSSSHNPRSTVGTVTEVYDHLRLLFSRAGRAHCHECGREVTEQSPKEITEKIFEQAKTSNIILLAPMVREQKGEHKVVLQGAMNAGYHEVRYDGTLVDIDELLRVKMDKKTEHTIEVVIAKIEAKTNMVIESLLELVKQALELGNGLVMTLDEDTLDETLYSQSLYCPDCDISLPALEPRLFSFNSPHGACPACTGLGTKLVLEPDLVIPNKKLTIAQGAIKPWTRIAGNQTSHLKLIDAVGQANGFSVNEEVRGFSKKSIDILFEGTGDREYDVDGKRLTFPGILAMLEDKYKQTDSEYVQKEIETYMRVMTCPVCEAKRLRPEALAVTVTDKTIADLVAMPLDDLFTWFDGLGRGPKKVKASKIMRVKEVTKKDPMGFTERERIIVDQLSTEIKRRLVNLIDVGLNYLTLDRSAMSLSGGEAQRVRLAAQLGAELSGVIYILDEPSIGLHQRDNDKLINTMKRLRDLGNTIVVVEHDQAVMEAADHVIDVGPGAGEYGGEIIAMGTLAEIKRNKESLTGAYLTGKRKLEIPKKRRKGNGKALTVKGATAFNLQNVDFKLPLGLFACVTGVSGSGKSTLVLDILARALSHHFYHSKELPGEHKKIEGIQHLDKVVSVDQSPIGRTPRSNPATYTGVFTVIRDLFAEIPEAKMRGFDAGKFSFNVKGGGRCEACGGDGYVKIEMQFLPDVYVECSECHGRRYNEEALEIHWRGKNIADVLDMTVEEARRFFVDQPLVYEKLSVLHDVGLGYVKLGQPATTLSGGEAQRVKLATELSRRATGRTLYILDEPTTGLHFEDIKRLLGVLNALVDKGNTVLVIEHNVDVIKAADWIVDMGPEGGIRGGKVVSEGTPEQTVKMKKSLTGEYLKKTL